MSEPVVAYTEHLDECHKISDHVTQLIRDEITALKREAAQWEPAPYTPGEFDDND